MGMRSSALQLLDLFRSGLRGGQFVGRAYGTELSPMQSLMLDEIQRGLYTSQKELAKLFGIDRSNISRALSTLSEAGYLQAPREDSSVSHYEITKEGKAFLLKKRQFNDQLIKNRTKNFSIKEKEKLGRLLNQFADYQEAPPIKLHSGESEIFGAIRRLTYAHGVGTQNFIGSDVPFIDWTILSEIHYDRRDASAIVEVLGIKQSMLSINLRRFEKEALLIVGQHPEDKRMRVLTLTSKGEQVLVKVEKRAEEFFGSALKRLSATDRTALLDLFEKFQAKQTVCTDEVEVAEKYIARIARLPSEREILRWTFIACAQSCKSPPWLGGEFFSRKNLCIGMYNNEVCVAGFEIKHSDERARVLHAFAHASAVKELPIKTLEKILLGFASDLKIHKDLTHQWKLSQNPCAFSETPDKS